MPFRTAVFCGDDPDLLTPLMAAQMSGRAGRRGLDEEGHVVYFCIAPERIRVLMQGVLPDIKGRESYYASMPLQTILQHTHHKTYQDPTDRIRFYPFVMNKTRYQTLTRFSLNKQPYDDQKAREKLCAFGILKDNLEDLACSPEIAALVWELRYTPHHSLALYKLLPWILELFRSSLEEKTRNVPNRQWAKIKLEREEGELLFLLSLVFDRHTPALGLPTVQEESWITSARREWMNKAEQMLQVEMDAKMYESRDLDPQLFWLVVLRKTRVQLQEHIRTPRQWYEIKTRLWNLGCVVRVMHNCLQTPDFLWFALLLRKAFRRIQWTMKETFA